MWTTRVKVESWLFDSLRMDHILVAQSVELCSRSAWSLAQFLIRKMVNFSLFPHVVQMIFFRKNATSWPSQTYIYIYIYIYMLCVLKDKCVLCACLSVSVHKYMRANRHVGVGNFIFPFPSTLKTCFIHTRTPSSQKVIFCCSSQRFFLKSGHYDFSSPIMFLSTGSSSQ